MGGNSGWFAPVAMIATAILAPELLPAFAAEEGAGVTAGALMGVSEDAAIGAAGTAMASGATAGESLAAVAAQEGIAQAAAAAPDIGAAASGVKKLASATNTVVGQDNKEVMRNIGTAGQALSGAAALGGLLAAKPAMAGAGEPVATALAPTTPAAMPIPNAAAVAAARRRSIASQVARRGRASTILTDNTESLGG